MREKLQANGIKGLIAAMTAVLFLTCYLSIQPAVADPVPFSDGMVLIASLSDSGFIGMANRNNNSLINKFTVTYHPNGGKGQTKRESVDANTDYTVNNQGYTKDYCVFDCWNTRQDGLGTDYLSGQVISVTRDITLYARWIPNI